MFDHHSPALWLHRGPCDLKHGKPSTTVSGLVHLLFCLLDIVLSFRSIKCHPLREGFSGHILWTRISCTKFSLFFIMSWHKSVYLLFVSITSPNHDANRSDTVFHSLMTSAQRIVFWYLEGDRFLLSFITTLKNCVAVILKFNYIWSLFFFVWAWIALLRFFSEILVLFLFVLFWLFFCYFYMCVYVCHDHFNWN